MISGRFRSIADDVRMLQRGCDEFLPRELLRRTIRYVNEHLDAKLKWNELADEVGLGQFVLARRFKLSTGMTLHQYIIRCRLKAAMILLSQTELSLADVALEVGCSCQCHLTRLFRKYLHTTPRKYRVLLFGAKRACAPIRVCSPMAARATFTRGTLRGPGAC